MDNPIIFNEDDSKRFYMVNAEGGKFYVKDKEDKFPTFFVESGVARKIANYLNEKENEVSDLEEQLYFFKNIIKNSYNNHYLVKAINEGIDDNKLSTVILDRLPKKYFKVENNDKFLIIEQINNELYLEPKDIANLLNINIRALSFHTLKFYNKNHYMVLYFDWETIMQTLTMQINYNEVK